MTTQKTELDARPTISEAVDLLTYGEVGFIEKHHGKNLNDLSGIALSGSLIWALKRREVTPKGEKKFDWPDLALLTLKQINEFFRPEPEAGEEDASEGNGSTSDGD